MNNYHFVHVAGDTLDQQITVPEYPSTSGWTLKYQLTPRFTTPTQAVVDLTAVSNADGTYQLQASPATTANWLPGAYGWGRWVEKTGARQTLSSSEEQGEVLIRQNPDTAVQGYDSRSTARKLLDQYEAALLALNSGVVKSYTIGSRQMTYQDKSEIIEEISRLRWDVDNEKSRELYKASGINRRVVGVRLVR